MHDKNQSDKVNVDVRKFVRKSQTFVFTELTFVSTLLTYMILEK